MLSFSSSSSTDESSSSAGVSSGSVVGADNSLNTSALSTSVPSVNPSPIVSSHADDGYSSPLVLSGRLTSTPVASGSAGSQNSSQNQHNTTPRCRPQIENPLVRVELVPQDLADKEASEMKQRRKEERERKKMEKEKERERKEVERGEKKKGRGKGKGKRPSSIL